MQPVSSLVVEAFYYSLMVETSHNMIFSSCSHISLHSNASSYHTRQAYKDRLVQQGHDEAMKNFVMGLIKDAFTCNDPKMLELRSQMFR